MKRILKKALGQWKYKYRLLLNAKYVGYKTKMRIIIARLKNKFGGTKWK